MRVIGRSQPADADLPVPNLVVMMLPAMGLGQCSPPIKGFARLVGKDRKRRFPMAFLEGGRKMASCKIQRAAGTEARFRAARWSNPKPISDG
jgi:hypothetical protein